MDIKKVRENIVEKSAELKGLFDEIKDQEAGATPEQKQAVIDRNEELPSLRDDLKVAEAKSKLDISGEAVASMPNPSEEPKAGSFGAEVMKSAALVLGSAMRSSIRIVSGMSKSRCSLFHLKSSRVWHVEQ